MARNLKTVFKTINWRTTLGYFGLFVIFFFAFLYITFPYGSVKNALIAKMESSAPVHVEIDKLTPYRLTGIKAENVTITSTEDSGNVLVKIDRGRVRIHLLPLLAFKVKADVDLYTFGGGMAGQIVWRGQEVAMAANFRDLDISRIGADRQLKKFGEIRMTGKLGGSVETYINNQEKKRNRGQIRLEYNQLNIANSTILGNKFPEIVFKDPAVVQMSLTNRYLKIDEWSLTSDALDIKASGRVTLREKIENSRFNIKFQFKPSDEIEDSLGMFGMMLPEPDANGYYNFTFSGTAQNPRFKKQ